MGARIAPGLALLLCCPVLGSAFALVSPRRGGGLAPGSLGEEGVFGVQSLGFPSPLNFAWGSPLTRVLGAYCLWGVCILGSKRLLYVSLFLKVGFGVPGLEVCGWGPLPSPCVSTTAPVASPTEMTV